MPDPHAERLAACFEKVFPHLDRAAIPAAAHGAVPEWDSIAQVTLLSLIGEEFALDIDFEDFEDAASFASILEIVRARSSGA
jgi:acyl carrier protein